MGEKEVFTHQINQFLKLLDKQGIKYFIDIKKDMYHAYVIFDFTKHAKDANKKIIEILNKD
jgi:ribosome-binding factor A